MTSEDPPVPHGPFPPSWLDESHYYVAFRLRITKLHHASAWYDPQLYPKKDKTGQRNLEGVPQTAASENDRIHRFCLLPLELREMVTIYLDNADILSLRATSRAMRNDVGYELNQRQELLTQDDYIELTKRMYVDRFARMSEAEKSRGKLGANAMILCGFCLIKHRTSAFAPEEVDKTPFIRACRGALGRFVACEHGDLSFVQILQKLGVGSELSNICPRNKAHTQQQQQQTLPISIQPQLKRLYRNGEICIRQAFMVEKAFNHRPENWKLPKSEHNLMDQRVSSRNMYICPHLRTSSQNLWQHGIATSPIEWQDFDTRAFEVMSGTMYRFRPAQTRRSERSRFARCGQVTCQTRFGFEIFVGKMVPQPGAYTCWLNFWIWRKLGSLQDNQDPLWRAQIETP
jgi:hypothetical protein